MFAPLINILKKCHDSFLWTYKFVFSICVEPVCVFYYFQNVVCLWVSENILPPSPFLEHGITWFTCRRKLDDITYHIFPSNIKTEKESIVKQYVIDFPHGILVSSTSVLLSMAVSSNHIQISNTTSTYSYSYSYSSAPNPNSPAKIISHIIKKPLFSKILFQTLHYLVSHSLLKKPSHSLTTGIVSIFYSNR